MNEDDTISKEMSTHLIREIAAGIVIEIRQHTEAWDKLLYENADIPVNIINRSLCKLSHQLVRLITYTIEAKEEE